MILIDFNGLLFQYMHSCISFIKPEIHEDGLYDADDILPTLKTFLINELFNIQKNHLNIGEVVLCVDNTVNGNWRKNVYTDYKHNRIKNNTDESNPIPFKDIFKNINELLEQFKNNTPWKVISVEHAEGDDCILCLADTYSKTQQILIISSDKDMLQAQKNANVRQYSPLTKKWISCETKDVNSLNEWLLEHVILGDAVDDVPRIFDETEYTEDFENYLLRYNLNIDPKYFNTIDDKIIEDFYAENPESEIWIKLRIGPKKIQKMIKDNTIDDFINKYKDNFERNKRLVLSEYIPEDIKNKILQEYKTVKTLNSKNTDEFVNYLTINKLGNCADNIPANFRCGLVTIDDFL